MTKIKAKSLVGGAKRGCWSQAQSWEEDNQRLILILSLRTKEGEIDLASMGGAIVEKFYANKETLKKPLEAKDWLELQLRDLSENGVRADSLIVQITGQRGWFFGVGEVAAILIRGDKQILIGKDESWNEGVSGEIVVGDRVMLGTTESIEWIGSLSGHDNLQGDIETIGENIAPLVHQLDNQERIALMLLENVSDESEEETKVGRRYTPMVFVKRLQEKPHKLNLIAGVGLAGLIVIMIIVGVVVKSNRQAKNEFEEVLDRSSAMIKEAEEAGSNNPERAKILVAQSKEILQAYLSKEQKKADYRNKIEEQLLLVSNKESQILKIKGITLTPTIELSILGEGLTAERMSENGEGSVYFWDEKRRGFVGFSLKDLSKDFFAVESERFVAPFSVSDDIFVGVAGGGVWRGDESEQKIVIESDEEWGKIGAIATFGSNIYLLDNDQGEIWKYAANSEGYGKRQRWFGAGIRLDLSKIVDWAIDGDMWLLSSSGKLEKYSRGVPAKFGLTGFPSEREDGGLIEPIAVSSEGDKVFVLERGAGRVVVFDQEGKYLQQYESEDFAKASDLIIYESKGYVLVDNVVKEWEL